MDPVLRFPLILAFILFLLYLLSTLTRAARARSMHAVCQPQPQPQPQGLETSAIAAIKPFRYSPETTPKDETCGWWWSQVLSGRAVLGAIFLPLQLVILVINSYVLSIRLEVVLGRAGDTLFDLTILGWTREITLFDIVGLLISLIQIIAAAAFVHSKRRSGTLNGASLSALSALLCMILLEVSLSVLSGIAEEGPAWIPALNGLLAMGLALTDSLCGVFVIEYLMVPLTLSIAWSLASPVRTLAKWTRLKASQYEMAPKPLKSEPGNIVPRLYRALGSVDPIFQPFRDLDAFAYRRLRPNRTKRPSGAQEEPCLEQNS
jgi:hypothetical protein